MVGSQLFNCSSRLGPIKLPWSLPSSNALHAILAFRALHELTAHWRARCASHIAAASHHRQHSMPSNYSFTQPSTSPWWLDQAYRVVDSGMVRRNRVARCVGAEQEDLKLTRALEAQQVCTHKVSATEIAAARQTRLVRQAGGKVGSARPCQPSKDPAW